MVCEFDRGKCIQRRRSWLEMKDINEIEKLTDSKNELIRKVSICFLLMVYTGMRFSDAMRFDAATHVKNNERIIMRYKKFGTEVNLKMHDRLRRVVTWVEANHMKASNQYLNDCLKIVATACNISLNLSAHVGRHTMGSSLADLDIPAEQAQIILGHKNVRSTRIYYHLKAKSMGAFKIFR